MDEKKKKKIIIGCVTGAFVILVLVLCLCLRGCSGSSKQANTIKLIERYMERGEYDRALTLLENLLLNDPDNENLNVLLDTLIMEKQLHPNGTGGNITYVTNNTTSGGENSGGGSSTADYNGKITVDVDTSSISDGIASAMNDTLSSMKDALAKSNKQVEQNQKAVQDLLKLQAENDAKNRQAEEKRLEAEQQRLEAEKERLAQEKEAAEQRKAQEEQRKIEEEKRKAQEAELAKKNEKLKKEIDAINEQIQLGKTALATGNNTKALEYFEKAKSLLPVSDGEPAFSASKNSEIAQALYDAADHESNPTEKAKLKTKAVEIASEAVAKNPKDAASHYILASDAYEKKNYQQALEEFSKAVQYEPGNYLYYYNLGKTQYVLKKYSEAASSFNTSCKLNGKFHLSRYNLGLTYLKLGKDKEALDSFRKSIEIEPMHENSYLEQARLLSKNKDYMGAIASYKKTLEINNSKTVAWQELGNACYQSGKLADSESAYRQALTLMQDGRDKTLTQYNLSTVLYEENKKNDALSFARLSYGGKDYLSKNAEKAQVVYNYALLLDQNGKSDDAIPVYMEVLTLNPDHDKTKINLGVMYMNLEPPEVDMALNLFTQVYNKDPKNFEATNNLGSAYLEKEDYNKAIEFYQKAVILDPKNNDVRLNLGRAFTKNADYANAKTTLQEVIRSDANVYDAYIELAKVCMQLGDNDEAEGYLYMLQEKNPTYRKAEVESLLSSILNQ